MHTTEGNDSKSETMNVMSSSIPQPNSNSTILDVIGSTALFEPAVGLTNVFDRRSIPIYRYFQMC